MSGLGAVGSIAGGAIGFAVGGPMGAAVGASIGGGIGGGLDASDAAKKQAAAQLKMAERAEALNRERYGEAVGYMSPYIESAEAANQQLQVEMGLAPGEAGTAYMNAPGYEAAMKGVQQNLANTGGLYSGARANASGEVQSQFYTNYMNILQGMASPQSATNLSSMGLNQGIAIGNQNVAAQNNASNYRMGAAQTQQAMIGDAVGGAANIYGAYMGNQTPATPATGNYYGGGYVPPGGSFGSSNLGAEGTGFEYL